MPDAPKSSDQLPEEAPPEQVPDDMAGTGEGAARETARRHLRPAGERGRARYRDHSRTRANESAGPTSSNEGGRAARARNPNPSEDGRDR